MKPGQRNDGRPKTHRRNPFNRPLVIALFALAAAWLLWRQLHGMSWSAFTMAVLSTPPSAVVLSIVLAAISYACLSGTEWLALRAVGHPMRYREAALVAIPAYALTNSAGFSPATGTVFRLQTYARKGLLAKESAVVALVAGAAVTLSGVVAMGLLILADPDRIGGLLHRSAGWAAAIGALMLIPAALWFWAFTPQAPRWLGGEHPARLGPKVRALGLAAGLGDWLFSCAALFVLLPDPQLTVFPAFLAASIAGSLVSAATGVPGGLGVFEAVVLSLTSLLTERHATAAALLLYRCIYSFGPLTIWGLASAIRLRSRRRRTIASRTL